ncbi:hypothetical protein MMC26_005831 [Xylographa opegraphella]|nr:hypothetical protein [Xylographa opegraphella]
MVSTNWIIFWISYIPETTTNINQTPVEFRTIRLPAMLRSPSQFLMLTQSWHTSSSLRRLRMQSCTLWASNTISRPSKILRSTNLALTALKDLAEHKFGSHGFTEWSSQLPEVIELVYTTTPDSDRRLRDITRDKCAPHASSLIHDPAIVEVMLEVPAFGIDLCKGILSHSEHLWNSEKAKMELASEKEVTE